MSKAIVKHGGGLAGVAGNVAEVMALLEGRGLSPTVPEIFDLSCVCAVHDKPYTLRFERQASGLLRFRESIKGRPSLLPDNARAGGKGWTLRMQFFEDGATPCAWCGDRSFGHCSRDCGALVCCGRMRGNTFYCRPSCGASWVGVPMREVEGTAGQHAQMSAPARDCLPSSLPVPARLLLPAAKGPVRSSH
jgi:hypothetical protein